MTAGAERAAAARAEPAAEQDAPAAVPGAERSPVPAGGVASTLAFDQAAIRALVADVVARTCASVSKAIPLARVPVEPAGADKHARSVPDVRPVLETVARMRAVIGNVMPLPVGREVAVSPIEPQPSADGGQRQIEATRAAMAAMRAAAAVSDGHAAASPQNAAPADLGLPAGVRENPLDDVRRLQRPAPIPRPTSATPLLPAQWPVPPLPLAPIPAPPANEVARLPASAVRVGVARSHRSPHSAQMAAPATDYSALAPSPSPLPAIVVPLPLPRPPLADSSPDSWPHRPGPGWRLVRGVWTVAIVGVRLAILAVLALALFWSLALLSYRFIDPPASTLMLGQYATGRAIEQRWVAIERISPNLIRAVIASEDGNFCRHRGVDWSAIDEALDKAAEDGGRPRGASTISMQTVKNLLLWPQAHYIRKVLELPLAYLAELAWGKRRMLELYLNIAEWGPGVFGAEAAAHYHFRKSAAALSIREAALLAVALPNPIERNAGSPGPGTQRLGKLIETRAARPTLTLACLGLSRQLPIRRPSP